MNIKQHIKLSEQQKEAKEWAKLARQIRDHEDSMVKNDTHVHNDKKHKEDRC